MKDYIKSLDKEEVEEDTRFVAYARVLGQVVRKARLLSYSSELGESVRPIATNKWIVNGLYGISFGYVGVDITISTVEEYQKSKNRPDQNKRAMIKCIDQSSFHSMASLLFPSIAIHSVVKYTDKGLNLAVARGLKLPGFARFLPSILGIASIPFIIHPLDELADLVMDNTLRKIYDLSIEEEKKD